MVPFIFGFVVGSIVTAIILAIMMSKGVNNSDYDPKYAVFKTVFGKTSKHGNYFQYLKITLKRTKTHQPADFIFTKGEVAEARQRAINFITGDESKGNHGG